MNIPYMDNALPVIGINLVERGAKALVTIRTLVMVAGNNCSAIMIVAPIFMAVALALMWGVKRREAIEQAPGD